MKNVKLNISMPPAVKAEIVALQKRTGAPTLADVFRTALARYHRDLDVEDQKKTEKEPRIIDRDIDSYTAFVENHESALRRCVPSEEQRNARLADAAAQVVAALKDYRYVVDKENGVLA